MRGAPEGSLSLLHDEGRLVQIPAHLAESIEVVTDELRECMEELESASAYCLRAFYDGRLPHDEVWLDAILRECVGPPTED